ncbi:glutamyl-tRNA reductase [Mesocricetibacter intestinalis]|uniref:Glutamyl-tRNA reductase n=1 Tax=Mesocricetibacter intestinalis TaxID=1521930 RepID=A0A4R6VB31_9PAST|nr:glutamyl-tRNA reductase [Mesocricetibacter intestinalis]TDQ57341.1 glutamyl-tRNA reductase [Mesocricetibacter intestinalis]
MTILVLGINHKTATVAVREKVAFSEEKRRFALQQIREIKLAQSAVILSTCNRTEIYLHDKFIPPQEESEQNRQWLEGCIRWFAEIHQLEPQALENCLYAYQNQHAVKHLMRVAGGLDSLILGEPQILGQVKQAYQSSTDYYQQQAQAMSGEFSRLFQKAFSVAKRVRTETSIGDSAVSVAYAACGLARQIFENLQQLNILLVGAGETIELVARHLLRHGVKKLTLSNRTLSRAEQLVHKLDAADIRILALEQLQSGLNEADIVISSTASPNILITRDMMKAAQQRRKNAPSLIIDIAVPRDVEESVAELDSVYHYTVDDLHNIIRRNLSEREKASKEAEKIIQHECEDFFEWLKIHQVSDLIRLYREEAENIRQGLVEKAIVALHKNEDAEKVLQELSYKLMNKLIHSPTQAMQLMVKRGNTEGLQSFSSSLGIKSEADKESSN